MVLQGSFFLADILFYALRYHKPWGTQSCILHPAMGTCMLFFVFRFAWSSLPQVLTEDNFVHCIVSYKAGPFAAVWCVLYYTDRVSGGIHCHNRSSSNCANQRQHFCAGSLGSSLARKPFLTCFWNSKFSFLSLPSLQEVYLV